MAVPVVEMEAKAGRALATQKPVVLENGSAVLRGVGWMSSMFSNLAFMLPIVAGLTGWVAKKAPKTAGPLAKVGQAAAVVDGSLADASENITKLIGENSALSGTVKSAGSTVGKYAEKVLGKGMTEGLKKNSVSNTVLYGSMVVGEATSTALSIGQKIRTLKQMQKDLTGQTPSTWSVLMGGGLHPIVMQARSELAGGRATLGTTLQVGGTVANAALMFTGRTGKGMKAMLLPMALGMGTSMAAGTLTAGNTALAAYRDMHARLAQGAQITQSDYVALIGGLAKGAKVEMIQTFAQQCAAKQLRPEQVLKLMSETTFFKQSPAAQSQRSGLSTFAKVSAVALGAIGLAGAVAYKRGTGDSWQQRVRSGMTLNPGMAR